MSTALAAFRGFAKRLPTAASGRCRASMTVDMALTLTNSWPIYEAPWRLPARGDVSSRDLISPRQPVGQWSCNLPDEALKWSREVYAIFGLPVEERVTRSLTRSFYESRSRQAMEQLRAYALRHRRGFTLEARIRRVDGDMRWMRLIAAPVLCDGKIVRLAGTKQDITAEYEGGL